MNYFHYFSEIEERFSRRRGSILLLSTLDWALIETWREAGIPLDAVLRGIDNAFEKRDAKAHKARGRSQKVNGLGWCAQAVMQATEEMAEAATGLAPSTPTEKPESGFENDRVARFLETNASAYQRENEVLATRLRELATTMRSDTPLSLDDLDRTLTVLEEKLLATLQSTATEEELVALRTQADTELAPYRSKISSVQLKQVQQQFLHKKLLEARSLPRLSLFYMGHE